MKAHVRSASLSNTEAFTQEACIKEAFIEQVTETVIEPFREDSQHNLQLLDEAQLLRVSLNDYAGSLAEHQSAFLHWLDEISKRPTEVDRYQYKKIR